MKKIFNLMMTVAMLSVMSFSLMSCGSNDDEEEVIENGASNKQRIELTITGDTYKWIVAGSFFGYTNKAIYTEADQNCKLSINQTGDNFSLNGNAWQVLIGSYATASYPIIVEMEGNSKLFLSMQVLGNSEFIDQPLNEISITIKGYRGNKLTNSLQRTFSNAAYIFFHADKSMDTNGEEGVMDLSGVIP